MNGPGAIPRFVHSESDGHGGWDKPEPIKGDLTWITTKDLLCCTRDSVMYFTRDNYLKKK